MVEKSPRPKDRPKSLNTKEKGLMSSPRPKQRMSKEDIRLRDISEGLGGVEARADFDPAMSWNPIARLGFKGFDKDTATEFGKYRNAEGKIVEYDNAFYLPSRMTQEDAERSLRESLVPEEVAMSAQPDSIVADVDRAVPSVWSHEMTHRGFDRIIESINEHPEGPSVGAREFKEKYGERAFDLLINVDNEKVTEAFDYLEDKVISSKSPEETLDKLDADSIKHIQETLKADPEDRWSHNVERYEPYLKLMQAAQDILTESGEPPKSPKYEESMMDKIKIKLGYDEGGMADDREIAGFDMSDMEFYTPETGVDQQMSEAFNDTPVEDKPSPLSRRPGFRGKSAFDFSGFGDFLKENVSQEELKDGLDLAAQGFVPFYDSGVNVYNVIEEYQKPEDERDYEYINSEMAKAKESAMWEAGGYLAIGALGKLSSKYGPKALNYLKNKVKQYKTDPNIMSAPEGMGSVQKLNEGGEVMNMQKQMSLFEYGGIADDGMKKDPVSGNAIPPGSMASEVRDDIPAMLSEGEYVVPADVLRYYGVNFFEGLRNKAKQGLQTMEQDGRIGGEPLSPQQIQQNMGKAPQAGQPAPMPVQAADGVLTQLDPYMKQAQQLGGGQQFNPDQWSTVGGSTFTQQPTQDSVTTFKTFVNAQTGEKQVLEFVDGKLKNPAMEKYTAPPYYEFGSAALKKAQNASQEQQSSGGDGGPETTPTGSGKSNISAFSGKNVNITDPLGAAKSMVENVPNFGGKLGMAGAALLGGPMGMTALGVGQTATALSTISDLNAMAILAEAQGKKTEAEQITKMVKDITGKSSLATQSLASIAAQGTQKAQGVIDRLGIDLNVKDISKWTSEQKAQVAKMAEHVQKVSEDTGKDPSEVMVLNQDLSNMEAAQQHAEENPTGVTTGDPSFQDTISSAVSSGDVSGLMPSFNYKGGLMAKKKKK